MKKRTKRLLGGAAAAAAVGAIGTIMLNRNRKPKRARTRDQELKDAWARPGMNVTFRAELMPGRDASERTYQVTTLLSSGRVELAGVAGEHAQKEFERVR